MRKALNNYEEERLKDSTDSDSYCLDNLDLLNLRVSFSSDATVNKLCKNKNRPQLRLPEITSSGVVSHRHPPGRCQHIRKREFETPINTFGSQVSRIPAGLIKKPQTTKYPLATHQDHDNKSVLLLYTNTEPDCNSSELLLTTNRKQNKTAKPRLVDIHTVAQNMPQRSSSRKQTNLKISPIAEGPFPFKVTPSGNFKVSSEQVAFENQKISVLVADPHRTKVNIRPEISSVANSNMSDAEPTYHNNNVMDSIIKHGGFGFGGSLNSLIASTAPIRREKESSEYDGKATENILDPELNLNRLGYTSADPIDWKEVKLPEKTNLYLELYQRITNYTNADCKVYIGNEEFNCHLLVLQCYSGVFDEYVSVKKVELPADKVSTSAFAFIYEWMISGEPAYTELSRESVLDTFNAAKYLKIKDLTEQCWAFIDTTDVFNEDTAFLLYMDARMKDLDDVRELMLPRIQTFFLMLVSSQDWLELEKDDVTSFLSSNYICVNCEMEVFMSAVRWLRHQWDTRQHDVIEIMECVRFGNLAPWQLVDIKRNPDNPEFLKLTCIPQICKMIDDGLAFVIIKYWYGQENDDFQHWNNILGLQEPSTRNWSGQEKSYFTYREFLIYLDKYRRNQMIEKTKPKDRKRRGIDGKLSPDASVERFERKAPTMDDFMINKKLVGDGPHRKKNPQ